MEFLGFDGMSGQLLYVISCAILGLIAWLILSIPGALAYSGAKIPLKKGSRLLQRYGHSFVQSARKFLAKVSEAFEALKGDSNKFIFSNNEKVYLSELRNIGKSLSKTKASIKDYNRKLNNAVTNLNTEIEDYKENINDRPDFATIEGDFAERKITIAKTRGVFWLFLLISIALVILNTVLFSMALGEVFPDQINAFGIRFRPALGLAFIFSLFEIVLGVAISQTRGMVRFIALLIVVVLMCVETWLYTLIANGIQLPPSLSEFMQVFGKYGIAAFGPLLGIGMPLVGFVMHENWAKLQEAKQVTNLSKLIKRANAFVESLPKRYQKMATYSEDSLKALDEFKSNLSGKGKGDIPQVSQSIIDNIDALKKNAEDIAESRRDLFAEVGEDERRKRGFSAIGIAAFTVILFFTLPLFMRRELRIDFLAPELMGVGAGIVIMLLGNVLFKRVMTGRLSDGGDAELIEGQEMPWIKVLVFSGFLIVSAGLWVLAYYSVSENWFMIGLFLQTLAIGLLIVGAFTATAFEGLWFVLQTIWLGLVAVLSFLVSVIAFILKQIFALTSALFYIIGFPTLWIYKYLLSMRNSSANKAK